MSNPIFTREVKAFGHTMRPIRNQPLSFFVQHKHDILIKVNIFLLYLNYKLKFYSGLFENIDFSQLYFYKTFDLNDKFAKDFNFVLYFYFYFNFDN